MARESNQVNSDLVFNFFRILMDPVQNVSSAQLIEAL